MGRFDNTYAPAERYRRLARICPAVVILLGTAAAFAFTAVGRMDGVNLFGLSDNAIAASSGQSMAIWSLAPGIQPQRVEGLGKVGVHSLLWSSPSAHGQWATEEIGDGRGEVRFFDSSSPPRTVVAELKAHHSLGFTEDGKEFLYINGERGLSLNAVDPQTGKLLDTVSFNTAEFVGAQGGPIKATPDGKILVLCMGDQMVAKDHRGKELWRIISGKGDNIYLYPPQPAVGRAICVFSRVSRRIYMIDILKGKPFSEFDEVAQWSAVLAVSQDCTKAIFAKGTDGYEIRSSAQPNEEGVPLASQGLMELKFSFDGKEIYGMPRFKQTNNEPSNLTLSRGSTLLDVWDAQTGKLLRSIDLKIPEAAANASQPQSAPTTQP